MYQHWWREKIVEWLLSIVQVFAALLFVKFVTLILRWIIGNVYIIWSEWKRIFQHCFIAINKFLSQIFINFTRHQLSYEKASGYTSLFTLSLSLNLSLSLRLLPLILLFRLPSLTFFSLHFHSIAWWRPKLRSKICVFMHILCCLPSSNKIQDTHQQFNHKFLKVFVCCIKARSLTKTSLAKFFWSFFRCSKTFLTRWGRGGVSWRA